MEILSIIINVALAILVIIFLFKTDNKNEKAIKKPIILMADSTINVKALKDANISENELLSQARLAGFFNLGDVDAAILEPCGKISFLPKPMKRPLNPKDFNFSPIREGVCRIIIKEGKIIKENLDYSGISERALFELLSQRGSSLQEIYLASANEAGRIDFFFSS